MIYTVNDGDLVACFAEKVTDSVVKAMADKQPLRVIFRDSCFEQDADKINIYETFKQLLDWSDKDVERMSYSPVKPFARMYVPYRQNRV